jgi:hypothetical protein
MLFLKRGLMAAGALALAAMLLNLVAPRAAHALVATAVQVMNTSATPVPNKDVDAPARNAYVLSCASSTDSCTTATIPPSTTLVVDSIVVQGRAIPVGATVPSVVVLWPHAGGVERSIPIALTPISGSSYAVAALDFKLYVDGGTDVLATTTVGAGISALLFGHLVSTP